MACQCILPTTSGNEICTCLQIDTEGPSSGIQSALCELGHGCRAELAPSSETWSYTKQNTTPSAAQHKQVIRSANIANEATAQSTIVNRPVPMPPMSKPPPVAQSICQDALLVCAPVDLTQWPIGNLSLLQGTIQNFQNGCECRDAADCIPPPRDLPDCDDWLGIDSSPAAPSFQPENTGRTCPLPGHERVHVSQAPQTIPIPGVAPPGLIAAQAMVHQGNAGPACEVPMPNPTDSLVGMGCDTLTASPGSCVQYPGSQALVQPELILPEWNAATRKLSLSAQSALPKQADIISRSIVQTQGFGMEPTAPATNLQATCESVPQKDVHVVQHVTVAGARPVSIADESDATHGLSAAAGSHLNPELADGRSPEVLPGIHSHSSQRTPEQARGALGSHEPMHWLFTPVQESDMQGLQTSPRALMPPGRGGFGRLHAHGPNHQQASCSGMNFSEIDLQVC